YTCPEATMTGAQYTVFRVITGALLALTFAHAPLPYSAIGLIAALLFTIGFFHRVSAVVMALTLGAATVGEPSTGRLLALTVLALHAALPPKPYGTLAMRGAVDPGSTWRFPGVALVPLWIALGLAAAQLHWALGLIPLL